MESCDLLENLYLCGSNNNGESSLQVSAMSCDLLENLYLCGSNNNLLGDGQLLLLVVICLKICTFAVATTTDRTNTGQYHTL